MESKMIGFLGTQKYDILLYLAKILCRMKQKVLLVDYAENRALTYCIPNAYEEISSELHMYGTETFQEEEKEPFAEECIRYQGFDFLVEPRYAYLLEKRKEYDIVLIDFGYQVYSNMIDFCDPIFLCMDQQLHHIMQMKPLETMKERIIPRCHLLLRQVYNCKISSDYVLTELGMNIDKENVFEYYEDFIDMKYCIDSQYNHTYHFMRISKGLKSCLLFILKIIFPEAREHQLQNAYRNAKNGRPLFAFGK